VGSSDGTSLRCRTGPQRHARDVSCAAKPRRASGRRMRPRMRLNSRRPRHRLGGGMRSNGNKDEPRFHCRRFGGRGEPIAGSLAQSSGCVRGAAKSGKQGRRVPAAPADRGEKGGWWPGAGLQFLFAARLRLVPLSLAAGARHQWWWWLSGDHLLGRARSPRDELVDLMVFWFGRVVACCLRERRWGRGAIPVTEPQPRWESRKNRRLRVE
jgi:hypothetical protein